MQLVGGVVQTPVPALQPAGGVVVLSVIRLITRAVLVGSVPTFTVIFAFALPFAGTASKLTVHSFAPASPAAQPVTVGVAVSAVTPTYVVYCGSSS